MDCLQNGALRVVFFTFFSQSSPGRFPLGPLGKNSISVLMRLRPNAKHDQNKYLPDRGELTICGRKWGGKIIIFFKYLRFTTLTVRANVQLRGGHKKSVRRPRKIQNRIHTVCYYTSALCTSLSLYGFFFCTFVKKRVSRTRPISFVGGAERRRGSINRHIRNV